MADYPDLIQPKVPSAQENRAPDLLIEGFTKGMAAFAQFAQIRRQQESDLAHMALQERLAGEQHELERQRLAQAAELIPSQIEANKAHANLFAAQAGASARGGGTAAQLAAEKIRKNEVLLQEVGGDVSQLQLEDVDFQTKHPVQYGKNVRAFAQKYRFSLVPAIRSAVKGYQQAADEQKILLKHSIVDEDGKLKVTGDPIEVPAWKVAERVADPLTSEQTMRDLQANGHMDVIESIEKFKGADGKTVNVPNKTTRLKPGLAKYVADTATPSSSAPVDYGVKPAGPALTPDDQKAIAWARAHPQDPMSSAILKKLGVQ